MDPRDVLKATLDDVASVEMPENLIVPAFEKLFDLHAGVAGATRAPAVPSVAVTTAGAGAAGAGTNEGEPGADDPLGAVARRAGVARETVAEVYDVRDGAVQLIIPTGKLASGTASGAKEIAILLAGGRQAAGTEEWTSLDVIRDACADFKKLDSGNFAKTIRSMEDVFNFRKESERKTSVKLSRPGWERFTTYVRRFGGEA